MTQSTIPPQSVGNLDSANLTSKNFDLRTAKVSEKTTNQLVAWARDAYQQTKQSRLQAQRQWYLNLAMYYGSQYYDLVRMASGATILRTPRAPNSHTVRHTVNLIRPMIRSEIARMTSQKPTATVTPATTSDNDMFAAQAGEQVWEWMQQRRHYQEKMMRNAFWTSITGTGFMKTWWDDDYQDDTAMLGEHFDPLQNAKIPAGSQQAVGDVLMDVVTPFNLFIPDLLEQDIENQPYTIEAYTRPMSWVKKFWPDVSDVQADVVSRNEIIETTYFNISGGNSAKPDAVLVLECWIKPGGSDVLPNGGMFTIVGNKVAQPPSEGMPYSHGQYPYAKFSHIPTGKFYGDSVLTDINLLQREYNRTRSHIIEAKALMGRPQILSPEGSIDPHKITAQPGLIITYKPGMQPPTLMPMAQLPAYVLQEQDRIKSDMEDISGQHSVTRGMAPGAGVTAATAISFLQERDDSIMGPTYASIEAGTEKIARQAISLAVDRWDLPRIIDATGLDQAFDSLELKGSDITNGKNLRVEGGSALPTSRAARQALLMDMVKMGVITGDQMLEMLDIGGIGKITELIKVDKRQAQRENLKMKRLTPEDIQEATMQTYQQAMQDESTAIDPNTGMPTFLPDTPATYPPIIPVNEWDNHQAHVEAHNNYRKSQEFEMLDDEVKEQFAKHVSQHQKALMLSMMGPNGEMPPGMGQEAPQDGQGQPQPEGGPPSGGQDQQEQSPNPNEGTPFMNVPQEGGQQ